MESFQEQLAIYTNKKKQDHSFKQSSSPSPRVTNEAIGLLSGRQRTTSKCCSISYATGSLQLCNLPFLDGAPLHIHYLWPVFVVLSALSGLSVSPIYACYSFVLGGPILFGSVLIHEFGHAYMALRLGGKVDKILLWPLGGLAYISFFGDSSPYSDALIAIAGPLTHIPMVLLWILLMYCTNHGEVTLDLQLSWGEDFWISLCAGAIAVQISLFCFNLIPAFPLDGGRLFGAWMSYKGIDRNRSFHWMSILGGGIGLIIFIESMRSITSDETTFFQGWNSLALSIFIMSSCYDLWQKSTTMRADQHEGYYEFRRTNDSQHRTENRQQPANRFNRLDL